MSDTRDTETEEETTLFAGLKKNVIEDRRAWSSQYENIRTDFGFYAGGEAQYDEQDLIKLREQNRPHSSFNFIMPSVNAVSGMEVSNRQEVTFLPRTTQTAAQGVGQVPGQSGMGMSVPGMQESPGADDQGPAEMYTAAGQYFRDQCDAEDEESDAFQDCAICGLGWTETRIDYEEDPQGSMRIDRIDPTEMGADCHANKRNLVDSRRRHRVRQVDKKAAQAMFPGYDIADIDASWAKEITIETRPHDREMARNYDNDPGTTQDSKTVTICEIEWFDVETVYKVANPATGEVMPDHVDAKTLKTLKKRIPGIAAQAIKKKVYKYAFLGKDEILDPNREPGSKTTLDEGTKCQSQKGFKFQVMTGTRDRNNRQWMGIVRTMRDPQRWANALYNSSIYNMMTSGKGIIAERDAFENPNEAETSWAKGDKIVWAKIGALSGQNPKIMPKLATPLPPGVQDLLNFAMASMRGVSGVNLELLGATDRDQAASLEYQRRQSATTILAPFFDGLRRYRKEQGRVQLDLIQKFLSDGRLIRIVGPSYEKYLPLFKDESVTEFDIIVGESPSSPNQKEASWGIIQQLLPVLGGPEGLGGASAAVLLKASPLPSTVVEEFQQVQQQEAANRPPSPEEQKMQLMQQQQQFDMAMAQQKGEQENAKMQADIQLKGIDLQIELQKLEQAKLKTAADIQLASLNIQSTREQQQFDRESQTEKHGADMEMRRLEFDAADSQEAMKVFGKDFPNQMQATAQAQLEMTRVLADAIKTLAQAINSERVTEMADPTTGQVMRAVSKAQTQQMVN